MIPAEPEEEHIPGQEEFDIEIFRLAIPVQDRSAEKVLDAVIYLYLQFRADGYPIQQIHTDRAREFTTKSFEQWCRSRSIYKTTTSGDSPQQNGRAERAVQAVKARIRTQLLDRGWGAEKWPLACWNVYSSERLRMKKKEGKVPPFGYPVLVRKRYWKLKELEPTHQKVSYIAQTPEAHGHLVLQEDGKLMITAYILGRTMEPPERKEAWIAVKTEAERQEDALEIRRRIRGKVAVRAMKLDDDIEEKIEDEENDVKERRSRVWELLEQEGVHCLYDDEEAAKLVHVHLKQMMKMQQEEQEEEVLNRVRERLHEWGREMERCGSSRTTSTVWREESVGESDSTGASEDEGGEDSGPSHTVEAGDHAEAWTSTKDQGGSVCGNFVEFRGEELFAAGADSAASRLTLKTAAEKEWDILTVDIRVAFLHAPLTTTMKDGSEDSKVVFSLKPPHLLVKLGYASAEEVWIAEKAMYGLRQSPRSWSLYRDETMQARCIPGLLRQAASEPNLWVVEAEGEILSGIVLVYVDDMLITGQADVVKKVLAAIQEKWQTSEPEMVTETTATKFLGMEISRMGGPVKASQEAFVTERLPTNKIGRKLGGGQRLACTLRAGRFGNRRRGECLWGGCARSTAHRWRAFVARYTNSCGSHLCNRKVVTMGSEGTKGSQADRWPDLVLPQEDEITRNPIHQGGWHWMGRRKNNLVCRRTVTPVSPRPGSIRWAQWSFVGTARQWLGDLENKLSQHSAQQKLSWWSLQRPWSWVTRSTHYFKICFVADIGTKPLLAKRLDDLKALLGMSLEVIHKKEKNVEVAENEVIMKVMKLLTVATLIEVTGAQGSDDEGPERQANEDTSMLFLMMTAYTLVVIVAVMVIQRFTAFWEEFHLSGYDRRTREIRRAERDVRDAEMRAADAHDRLKRLREEEDETRRSSRRSSRAGSSRRSLEPYERTREESSPGYWPTTSESERSYRSRQGDQPQRREESSSGHRPTPESEDQPLRGEESVSTRDYDRRSDSGAEEGRFNAFQGPEGLQVGSGGEESSRDMRTRGRYVEEAVRQQAEALLQHGGQEGDVQGGEPWQKIYYKKNGEKIKMKHQLDFRIQVMGVNYQCWKKLRKKQVKRIHWHQEPLHHNLLEVKDPRNRTLSLKKNQKEKIVKEKIVSIYMYVTIREYDEETVVAELYYKLRFREIPMDSLMIGSSSNLRTTRFGSHHKERDTTRALPVWPWRTRDVLLWVHGAQFAGEVFLPRDTWQRMCEPLVMKLTMIVYVLELEIRSWGDTLSANGALKYRRQLLDSPQCTGGQGMLDRRMAWAALQVKNRPVGKLPHNFPRGSAGFWDFMAVISMTNWCRGSHSDSRIDWKVKKGAACSFVPLTLSQSVFNNYWFMILLANACPISGRRIRHMKTLEKR